MRFPGYCMECRQFKQVAVTARDLASASVPNGTTIRSQCAQCERRAPRAEATKPPVNRTELFSKPLEK